MDGEIQDKFEKLIVEGHEGQKINVTESSASDIKPEEIKLEGKGDKTEPTVEDALQEMKEKGLDKLTKWGEETEASKTAMNELKALLKAKIKEIEEERKRENVENWKQTVQDRMTKGDFNSLANELATRNPPAEAIEMVKQYVDNADMKDATQIAMVKKLAETLLR